MYMTYLSKKGERTIGEPVKVLDISANEYFTKIRKRSVITDNNESLKKYVAVIYEIEGEDYVN